MGGHRRKTIGLIAAFLLALSPTRGQGFSDVPQGHWAAEAVEALVKAGILTGFPDGTFRGNDPVTRYQMAITLHRLYQVFLAQLQDLERLVKGGRMPEALEKAQEASRVGDLLTGALPPSGEEVLAQLASLSAQVQAFRESLAQQMGAVQDLKAFQESLVALESSQNVELMELKAQLDTLRKLLKDLVTREEFLTTLKRLADGVATLAEEVAKLKAAQAKAEERLKDLEAFAAPRKEDLSLRGASAQGAWATVPLPGPRREPEPGFGLSLSLAKGSTEVTVGAGLLNGMGYAQAGLGGNGESLLLRATESAGKATYEGGALSLSLWKAEEDQGLRLALKGEDLQLTLAGQYLPGSPPSPGALEFVGEPLPLATGAEARLELNPKGQGGLKGQVGASLTPQGGYAGASLAIPLFPSFYLGGVYAQAFDPNLTPIPEAQALNVQERKPSLYGLTAQYLADGNGLKAEAFLRYIWLPEGSGPGGRLSLDAEAFKALLAGQYVAGQSPWIKVYAKAEGETDLLKGKVEFGLAQGMARYQAFLEGLLQVRLSPSLSLGAGYGEFAASGGFGHSLTFNPDLNSPALYLGGSGTGLSQWATFLLGWQGFALRYDYQFRPRPADRFSLSYSLNLP